MSIPLDMLHWIALIALIVLIVLVPRLFKAKLVVKGYKIVPTVSYNWPIVGHGIAFSRDIMGFIQECRKIYGDIFHIKVFKKDICIVCDRDMVKEFFKKQEHEMSMYENLKSIYFDYAFSDDGSKLNQIIDIMNKTIAVRFDDFLPKIVEEALSMSSTLSGTKLLTPVTISFVARTSAKCFLGISLTDEMYATLNKFTNLLNITTTLTYFLPKFLIIQTIGRKLIQARKEFNVLIQPFISEYRSDIKKTDSLIMRHCVDREPELSDEEICDAIVCLLYVSSENTALGLNATITDLIKNPIYLEKLRAEILQTNSTDLTDQIDPTNYKEMIRNKDNLLHACVLESARLNSHVFAITRNTNKSSTLGEYYVGNIDHVVLCEPLLMAYESAHETFEDPTKYFPERYLINKSLANPDKIITWGAGPHLCPGKLFAIYEIKTAIISILTQYDIYAKSIPPLNYFSPSAFADRTNMEITIEKTISTRENILVQKVGDGILLRNYLSEQRQIDLYKSILLASENSKEHVDIINERIDRAFPICMWNNAYTGQSNCTKPTDMIELGNEIIGKFPDEIQITNIDSAYAQLFGADASMSAHYDQYVDWGISINLGASILFTFGKDKVGQTRNIVLNSGDIFIGDFSKNLHHVPCLLPNTPEWFKNVKNFGRTRCSIQLRNVSKVQNQKISDDEFKLLLKSY